MLKIKQKSVGMCSKTIVFLLQVVAAVLNQLNAIEMSAKQSFEIITRLFIELPNMKNAHLVELCEYCIESLRLGDPKCSGYDS